MTNAAPGLTGVALIVQGLLLAALEIALFTQGEGMYPATLLALTAGLGCALSSRLVEQKRITTTAAWALHSVHGSKLILFAVGQAWVEQAWAYPSALLVVLAVSPLYLAQPKPAGRRGSMPAQRAWAHVAVASAAVLGTRDVLIANLVPLFTGASDTDLSPSSVLGFATVAAALAVAPLPQQHFRHVRAARQLHTFAILAGMLLVAISPEVFESDAAAHLAEYRASFAAGPGGAAAPPGGRWVQWLLFVAAALSAAAATSVLPLPDSLLAKLIFAAGVGVAAGLYTCLNFLPPSPVRLPRPALFCTGLCCGAPALPAAMPLRWRRDDGANRRRRCLPGCAPRRWWRR